MESRTPSSVLSTTFVPVLDKAKSNPHFANAEVLTFAARFGICTAEILVKLEARVLSDKRLGNIAQSCGIFEAEGDMLPKRLKCSELPKRLFRSIKEQPSRAWGRASHGIDFIELLGLFHPSPTGGAMGERAPSPSSENVNLILQLLLLHDSDPNSHSGYPLAMTVHHSSEPLMGLLLYKGANPCMKKNLALQIAVRKGWDQGLRWMIEREERLERVWTRHELHVVQILEEATVAAAFSEVQHEITRHHGDPNPHSNKRRRLFDRLRPDPELLREAIRSDSWSIVDFLMAEKGVVPDMKSLKLMEKKKSKC
ncbi:hypothetical protein IE53DRAFT_311015 [Violaceomyces palustris]|uniref:Uncharacterized protein n=1 Tax=Violaceomyces palustris TaxID=1673888 RepID=A0ACD0P4M5_9BASI|nr:hypothetical protein IE53DRAFT_311015 [Violaceomyces palustris]